MRCPPRHTTHAHTHTHTSSHTHTHTHTLTHSTCSFSSGGQTFIQAAAWQPRRKEEGWGRGPGKQRTVGGRGGGCCLVPWSASVPRECEGGSKGPGPTGFFKNYSESCFIEVEKTSFFICVETALLWCPTGPGESNES